jgi:hypothetical protein
MVEKKSKASVDYGPGHAGGERCATCAHFHPDDNPSLAICEVVTGHVRARDWCTLFTVRWKSAFAAVVAALLIAAFPALAQVLTGDQLPSLSGTELLRVTPVNPGAGPVGRDFQTTTQAIANLSPAATPTLILPIAYAPGINPNNIPLAQIEKTRKVTAITCRPEIATGGTATITVVKAASGTALSAGTPLHSGSCNANGTAATDQTLTVTVSSLAAGDTVGLITTGTTIWTSAGVATGIVTVYVQ